MVLTIRYLGAYTCHRNEGQELGGKTDVNRCQFIKQSIFKQRNSIYQGRTGEIWFNWDVASDSTNLVTTIRPSLWSISKQTK